MEALSAKKHKTNLVEDVRFVALTAKEFEDILEDFVLESLKECEKATMMNIDRKPILEEVVLEFVIAHSEDKQRRAKIEELERIQYATEHGAALMSLYAAERQAK